MLSYRQRRRGQQLRRRARGPEEPRLRPPRSHALHRVRQHHAHESSITPGNDSISALTNPVRPMVGQSAYMVNAGLSYASRRRWVTRRCSTTWRGQRILEAGTGRASRRLREAPQHARRYRCRSRSSGPPHSSSTRKNLLDAPYLFAGRRGPPGVPLRPGVRGGLQVAALGSG